MRPVSRHILAIIAAIAVLTTLSTSPASAITSTSYEKQIIGSTNAFRAKHDKVDVAAKACVDRWAEGQARWMADTGKLQHREGRLEKILKDCGLTSAAENLAFGFSTGKKAVNAWTKSPGHRKNLLRSKMRYIGVGAVRDKDGVWWSAQVFGSKK